MVSSSINEFPITRIRDAKTALTCIAIAVAIQGFAFFTRNNILDFIYAQVYILIPTLLLLRVAQVRNEGVLVDQTNDTIEYYGGGISPDSVLDYINPMFWFQIFLRHNLKISEITQISEYSIRIVEGGQVRYRHGLSVQGIFPSGTANIVFGDEGRRDQLYNAIRSINRMGNPIIFE